jgi:hypothetical protein
MVMEATATSGAIEQEDGRPLSNVLSNADRCDTCGAQAFVWADIPNSSNGLLYCSHHFNKYEKKLREVAIDIFDERYKINLKASASSPD